ncbi:MAG: hypothetical protein R6W84_18430 [Promethearchaeia archaeon]
MSKYKKVLKKVPAYSYSHHKTGKKVNVGSHKQHYRIRMYKPISREKARKEFEKRSQRSQSIDKANRSKETKQEPDEEWLENINRMDVKGIDTYELTTTQKEKEFKKLLTNKDRFYEDFEINDSKETLRDQLGYANAIYDYSRVSFLSTTPLFNNSGLAKSLHKNNILEEKGHPDEIVLLGSTLFYKVGDNFYLKSYVDKGIKGLNKKDLKIQTKTNEEFPLILSDTLFVYGVAPRIIEKEEEGIKMNIQQFEKEKNKLRSKYTKKELGSKMGYSSKEINQYLKDELILHYLWDTKQHTKI